MYVKHGRAPGRRAGHLDVEVNLLLGHSRGRQLRHIVICGVPSHDTENVVRSILAQVSFPVSICCSNRLVD
jgi:hypothetical protein